MANWSKNAIGEFKFGECMFRAHSLVPRPLPDFISQPIFLHGCEIKSGSGLGTRLPRASITHDIIKKSVHYSERVSHGLNKSQLDSTASAMETFQIESCVRGHHISNLESARDYIKIASRAGKDH